MCERIDDQTPPAYVRHITLYDDLSCVLEKASAAANSVFGLDHGVKDFPVERRCVDEMCTLVTTVQDYLDQALMLLTDWYGASPSGDGPSANPQWRGLPDERSELPSAAEVGPGCPVSQSLYAELPGGPRQPLCL
jgi:hypothetical protein